MNELQKLDGKDVLIVGYGVEGVETERFLKTHGSCASITIADRSTDGPEYLSNQHNFDVAIRSPGVRKDEITIPTTTATNIFFSLVQGKTIGITGTKGKSTTAMMTHHLLQAAGKKVHLVGNIGTPMLSEVFEEVDPTAVWVVELSSYMLDDIRYSPSIAVAVSLYQDHLDYHGDFVSYANAKRQIMADQSAKDWFCYHPAFAEFVQWATESIAQTMPFPVLPDEWELPLIPGKHNRENLRGAVAAARLCGVADSVIAPSLRDMRPLPHRIERVGTFDGITFYDDAISTTPESTIAALDAVPEASTLLLGGLDRGYDYTLLIDRLQSQHLTGLILFPDTGATILGMLQDTSISLPPICQTESMEEAVAFAYQHTPQGNACLLSTAAPSYSIWKSFTEKGDLFQYWVKTYADQRNTKKTNTINAETNDTD